MASMRSLVVFPPAKYTSVPAGGTNEGARRARLVYLIPCRVLKYTHADLKPPVTTVILDFGGVLGLP
jgi:hypothetical protein